MIIDFFKLILLLLPTFLRDALNSLALSVIYPIQELFDKFEVWQNDIRLQASTTCQVIYIETMLNYKLLGTFERTIFITDSSDNEFDFIVNVPTSVSVDYNRLIAIVNKYKLFGKRFNVGQSAYTFEVLWTDVVCERIYLEIGMHYSGGRVAYIDGNDVIIAYSLNMQNWQTATAIATGSHSGWHVPSPAELQLFVSNRNKIGLTYNELLWSSTQINANNAVAVKLSEGGNQFTIAKSTYVNAWVIKSITIN